MPSVAREAKCEPKPARGEVLSLEVFARPEPGERVKPPTQFRVLVRHFLDRFFNNELASAEGDAKTRLVQVACTIGILPFVVALYLYTPYHMPHQVRPYWAQAGDHYFYPLYSMVAMGIVTIFEWDSVEQAQSFLNSPAYTSLRPQQEKADRFTRAYIVEATQ